MSGRMRNMDSGSIHSHQQFDIEFCQRQDRNAHENHHPWSVLTRCSDTGSLILLENSEWETRRVP